MLHAVVYRHLSMAFQHLEVLERIWVDFSTVVLFRNLPAHMQVLEMTPPKPHFFDFVIPSHHTTPCPLLSNLVRCSQDCGSPSPSLIIPSLKAS